MNLISAAPAWLTVLFILTIGAAAIEDSLRLKISNLTCLAVLIEGLVAIYLQGFSLDLWQNLAAVICVLVLGTFAFSAGLFGGGDVKLLAAVALWVNLIGLVWLIAATFIAGGLLAFFYIIARQLRSATGKWTSKDRRIPYGVAIALGALWLFAMQRPEHGARPLLPIKIVRPAR